MATSNLLPVGTATTATDVGPVKRYLREYRCERCGEQWWGRWVATPDRVSVPARCPDCASAHWDHLNQS